MAGLIISQLLSTVILFALTVRFRKELATLIQKIKLPNWILFLLTAIPFLMVEEHVNCDAYQCAPVIIPPTLAILMVFEIFLLVGVKLFRSKTVWLPTMIFSMLGVAFELFFGGLVGIPLTVPIVLLVMPWVAISYAWVAIVPLTILQE
jgi:hypothetical protein